MEWTIDHSQRLDRALASHAPLGVSRSRASALVQAGDVTVNGECVRKPAHVVQSGDCVDVDDDAVLSPLHAASIEPVDLGLSVLYENHDAIVIDKPAGMSVHPGAGMAPQTPTILHGAAFLLRQRGYAVHPGGILVHRLDKETTGCLLIATSPASHTALQEQFAARSVAKEYVALVAGVPSPAAATVDAPIGRSSADRTRMAIVGSGKRRESRTTYRTLAQGADASLVSCNLHTGRTHQIRVHLSSIGHPLLGDDTYTSPSAQQLTERYGIGSLCLHALRLAFDGLQPGSGRVEVRAPVPPAFLRAVEVAGIDGSMLSA